MVNNKLSPKVLGQLLLMQSVLNNLPDNKSVLSFVCKGLTDIPGISEISFNEKISKKNYNNPLRLSLPVAVNDSFFGELILVLSDIDLFKPYEPYLSNFVFMMAVVLEERKQRKINDQHKSLLKLRIKERTHELNLEKENLIESQRRFTDLMCNVKLLSVMLDNKGSIIFCNDFLLEITGYSNDEIMGKNWFDIFIPNENRGAIKEVFQSVMEGQNFAAHYENEILTRKGDKLIISWNNTVLHDSSKKVIGIATLGENISQRKHDEQLLKRKNEELVESNEELLTARQKAEESDRLKTAFLQNMSHEIRTPMNVIMGFSDLLGDYFHDKEKLEKFAKIINNRSMDLLSIINDILDISKIESNQLPVNTEECNLNELFADLTTFFQEYQSRINKNHIKFSTRNLYNEPNKIISTDTTKLKQIFINLIGNACKFTETGTIEAGCRYNSNNNIQFYVSDTGIGIEEQFKDKIFERFFQINQGGTGLGLAIAKGLVELLGGKISVESNPNSGSIFTFTIEHESQKSSPSISKIEKASNDFQFSGKTILIVEDDSYNAEYLKEIISATGAKILHTMYGEEALKLSNSETIDLVLMDIRLPDINGYEATKKIKKEHSSIKVIAQTAYALHGEKQKALDAGCNDYISKPTNKNLLLKLINKHLRT